MREEGYENTDMGYPPGRLVEEVTRRMNGEQTRR